MISTIHTKQFTIFLVIVFIGLGLYYYLESKSVQVSTYIPLHGESTKLLIGHTEFDVEVVGTSESMQRGLSGRKKISESSGMFFLFDNDGYHGFWMKEMLFPIDIVWTDKNLKIVTIVEGATPDSFPTVFKPSEVSRYVLEVSGGVTQKLGIKIGDTAHFLEKN